MDAISLLNLSQAAERLRAGGVVAYPTEAVYGLGCDPQRESSVRRILDLKSRDPGAGLILIADRFERFLPYVAAVEAEYIERARAAWPGPVTWLFPRHSSVPDWLAGRHDTIALRVTAHPVSRSLCASFCGAIVSTSANPSGARPARSPEDVAGYFGDAIDGVVAGKLGGRTAPSEIRELASGEVVREGPA